jgi:hypothetical protein
MTLGLREKTFEVQGKTVWRGRPCLAPAKSNRVTSLLYFFTAARISF